MAKNVLHEAVLREDVDKVIEITSQQPKLLDEQDDDGNTPLIHAATNKNPAITERLIKVGANLHIKNSSGRSALLFAADYLRIPQLRLLIDNKASINDTNKRGMNALMFILESQSEDKLETFEAITLLIDAGIDLSHVNEKDESALAIAITKKKLKFLQVLIAAKANLEILNSKQQNLLHLAIKSPEILSYLLTFKFDIEQKDCDGKTPLELAFDEKCAESAELLMKCNPNSENTKAMQGKSLLLTIVKKDIRKCLNILSSGVNLSLTDSNRKTALLLAIKLGNMELIQKIVEAGADLNAKDCKNISALELAINLKRLDIFKYLLSQGANPNITASSGESLLVANYFYEEFALALIEANANLDEVSVNKRTVLFYVVADGSLELVEAILARSKKTLDILTPVGKEIHTPLFHAVKLAMNNPGKYNPIIESLLQAGADAKIKCIQGYVVEQEKTCYDLGKYHPLVRSVLEKYIDISSFELKNVSLFKQSNSSTSIPENESSFQQMDIDLK